MSAFMRDSGWRLTRFFLAFMVGGVCSQAQVQQALDTSGEKMRDLDGPQAGPVLISNHYEYDGTSSFSGSGSYRETLISPLGWSHDTGWSGRGVSLNEMSSRVAGLRPNGEKEWNKFFNYVINGFDGYDERAFDVKMPTSGYTYVQRERSFNTGGVAFSFVAGNNDGGEMIQKGDFCQLWSPVVCQTETKRRFIKVSYEKEGYDNPAGLSNMFGYSVAGCESVEFTIPAGSRHSDTYRLQPEPASGKSRVDVLVPVEIKAYRPEMVQHSVDLRPADQSKLVIPDAETVNPGVRIRVNKDDDDYDSPYKSDADEDSVLGENDLIKVEFSCPSLAGMADIKVFLKRSDSKLRVWEAKEKGAAILKSEDEKELTLDAQGSKTIWVEAIDQGEGELEWLIKSGNSVVGTAGKLKFVTYKKIIVGLSGETFYSGGANENGMFDVCQKLYLEGYNVAYYDVNGINATSGDPAYREAGFQIWQGFVQNVGVFGHSHGGGATHDISKSLNDTRHSLGVFSVNFTGYVDAIQHDSGTFDPFAETRYPPGSICHWNYYQRHLPLRGDVVAGAFVNFDVNAATWGVSLTHTSIDASSNVQSDLISAIKTYVSP